MSRALPRGTQIALRLLLDHDEADVNQQAPNPYVHTRGGYEFRIEVRFLPYPWADFQYWAKVVEVVRHGAPTTELPFTPVQYHAASEADALEKAARQIDDWFDAHQQGA